MTRGGRLEREAVAGVGHHRRARIGDERHRPPLRQRRQQPRALRRAIVVVIGQDTARAAVNPVDLEEFSRLAGVLRRQDVGGAQDVERAQA